MVCCQLRRSKLIAYLLVLVLAFLVGVISNAIFSPLTPTTPLAVSSDYARRIEEWHRLHEAAGMTGDREIINQVFYHLACTNSVGETRGAKTERYWESEFSIGSAHLDPMTPMIMPMTESSSFAQMIMESHLSWSLKNPDFLKSVNSAEKARKYIGEHRWPK